jgi:hypothetical protein
MASAGKRFPWRSFDVYFLKDERILSFDWQLKLLLLLPPTDASLAGIKNELPSSLQEGRLLTPALGEQKHFDLIEAASGLRAS